MVLLILLPHKLHEHILESCMADRVVQYLHLILQVLHVLEDRGPLDLPSGNAEGDHATVGVLLAGGNN